MKLNHDYTCNTQPIHTVSGEKTIVIGADWASSPWTPKSHFVAEP